MSLFRSAPEPLRRSLSVLLHAVTFQITAADQILYFRICLISFVQIPKVAFPIQIHGNGLLIDRSPPAKKRKRSLM